VITPKRVLLAAVGIAAAIAGALYYQWWWREASTAELMSHLPQSRLIASIDFRAMRKAGILDLLAGARNNEESDYKQFVADTGFDYRVDLQQVLLAYTQQETLTIAQGRFDWNRITQYARKQGGACEGRLCRMPSNTPGRRLSLLQIRANTIGIASSTDPEAVTKIRNSLSAPAAATLPSQPVWVSIPPATLRLYSSALPAGTLMFATALADSDQLALGLGPKDNRFELALDARCRTPEQAEQIRRELEAATTMLAKMIAREKHTPNPGDLSGVLTKGEFRAEGARLIGSWPLERVFIEGMLGSAK
jgi:hypothetical protein